MTEVVLSILGVALAFAGLVSQLTKKVLVSFLLALLVVTTAVMAARSIVHESRIRSVQEEIVKLATVRTQSVDDLAQELSPTDVPFLTEALSRSVDTGQLETRVLELAMGDGNFIKVRGYYRP